MHPFLRTATEGELRFIACLDYGNDAGRHFEALKKVLQDQNGEITNENLWHPYEVIELGSHWLQQGHEREFVLCTLLVVGAIRSGFDRSTTLSEKFANRVSDYALLPDQLKSIVLECYEQTN